MTTFKTNAVLTGVLSLLVASTAHAQFHLVKDGNFELPVHLDTGFHTFATVPDWTSFSTGTPGHDYLVTGEPTDTPGPESGRQYAFLESAAGSPNNSEGISQDFDVTIPGFYDLTWWASSATAGPRALYSAAVFNPNDQVINGGVGTAPKGGGWVRESLPLVLGAGENDVQFDTFDGSYAFIDNVKLHLLVATAPDAGSTFLLLNLSFGGLALCARKRRKR